MARPQRIEIAGGIYHVTARGNRRADIFLDDHDRSRLLSVVARTLPEFDAEVLAYCLMDDHYHFVLQTHQPNLSALMTRLNGRYVQSFNRRHRLSGRLLEDRFKAIHIQEDGYLTLACAYVERNRVAASLVDSARQWRWSSFLANAGNAAPPAWLATRHLLAHVLGRELLSDEDTRRAQAIHRDLVDQARPGPLWRDHLRDGNILGDDAFRERVRRQGRAP